MPENDNMTTEDKIKCPETAPEEQMGVTDEERQFALKQEPRPPLPRYIFAAAALLAILAFLGGGIWYYRTNILPEKYYQKATALFKQERYREAEGYYLRVLKLREERKDVLYQIAYCLEKTGRTDEAIVRYHEHLKMLPGDARALTRLGQLYMKKGEYDKALAALNDAAKKDKNKLETWQLMSNAAVKAKDDEAAATAFTRVAALTKEPEEALASAKELMKLGAFEQAITAYDIFAKNAPEGDKRGEHGMKAAKIMLGWPTDTKLTMVPGKSLGDIKIGASKEEVKALLGVPEKKLFTKVGGKSMLADDDAEIWTYRKAVSGHGIRIIFLSGSVREIETADSSYKTENGLSLSNFLFAKNAEKLQSRKVARNNVVLCLAKGGGLTFYAYDLNKDGTDAKYKRLRIHKGDSSIDNVDGFSLLNLFH